jgi:hypothetical protein
MVNQRQIGPGEVRRLATRSSGVYKRAPVRERGVRSEIWFTAVSSRSF